MPFDDWWKDHGIESATPYERSAARKGWEAAAKAEREAHAKMADAKAMRCEEKVKLAENRGEATHLRRLALEFSVLAAEIRNRPVG